MPLSMAQVKAHALHSCRLAAADIAPVSCRWQGEQQLHAEQACTRSDGAQSAPQLQGSLSRHSACSERPDRPLACCT